MDLSISLEKAAELSEVVYKNAVEKFLFNGIQNDIAHILCEVSEAWVSKDIFVKVLVMKIYKEMQGKKWEADQFRKCLKGSLGEELSDIYIGVLSVARNENVNLSFHWGASNPCPCDSDNSVELILNMISRRISKLSNGNIIKSSISWRAINEALTLVELIALKCDIDLLFFVEEKIKYNETRSIKHI